MAFTGHCRYWNYRYCVSGLEFLRSFITTEVNNYQEVQFERDHIAYRAWVKLNGNPKKLTFMEWKALLRDK